MKLKRQSKIVEIINSKDIETQEELVNELQLAGYNVTQATISRDIRELKLNKSIKENGKNTYSISDGKSEHLSEKYLDVLKSSYDTAYICEQLLVVKTSVGMAMAVAVAIDNMSVHGVMGTIAGDDTIFIATKSKEDAIKCLASIKKMLLI